MSTATFLKSDAITQGTWYNGTTPVYGSDGYGIIGNSSSANNSIIPVTQGFFSYPAYATVTPASETAFCWANSASDARALEYAPPGTSNGTDTKRVEGAWYSATGFTVDVQDGSEHQIALYFWDVDGTPARSQQIQITDDNNGNAVLDTRTLNNFHTNSIWLVWNVSGKVTFNITNLNSNTNAILNGIFFDPSALAVFPPFVSRRRLKPAHYE